MIESFKIYRVDNTGTDTGLVPVDSVPADSVCTVYVGGNKIVDTNRAQGLGEIVNKEILQGVADIPNYVVMYDIWSVADNRSERIVEMDKNGRDVLPRPGGAAVIYVTEQNLNEVYRRRILPLFINHGPQGLWKVKFAYDGDREEIVSRLIGKIRNTMRLLNFQQDIIFSTMTQVWAHSYPYSDYNLEYPNEMFERILLPRITDEHGGRLDLDTALRRVRKLNILAQCHGGHVVRLMEKAMHKKMLEIGYTPSEINRIMTQVLVVAYAPSCSLGDSKFQFISFISAYDYISDVPNNWVYRYISDHRLDEAEKFNNGDPNWEWKLPPMFLGGRDGNVFMVKRRFAYQDGLDGPNRIPRAEHNNTHYVPVNVLEDDNVVNFTDDGKLLTTLAHNVIVNGIKNSLVQDAGYRPLPPIYELVLDNPNDQEFQNAFMRMTAAGNDFMRAVRRYVHEHSDEIHPPRAIMPQINELGR